MKKRLKTLSTIGALACGATSASASTVTASLSVTATVTASCTVGSPVTLAFGAITASTALPFNSPTNGTVTMTCTTGTPYYIQINTGANVSGTQARMTDGSSHYLPYTIYQDSAHTTAFPTTLGTLGTTSGAIPAGTGTGSAQTVTFYGQIPSGTTLPNPGSYSDTVTVTVNY